MLLDTDVSVLNPFNAPRSTFCCNLSATAYAPAIPAIARFSPADVCNLSSRSRTLRLPSAYTPVASPNIIPSPK